MKTNEPIPTLALDDLLHMAASAIEDLLEHTDPNTSYYSGEWADMPGKLRAAMLQASPVCTCPSGDGSLRWPCPVHAGSSPAIPDRWIPVSERMPTKQDGSVFLTWNGQYIGKELFMMGSFQCLKPEIITHWMPLPAAPQGVPDGK
ncbi:DUF551 domain-containing protein [Klebsiella michiganensis]|uniref:DUF551 domain-containing protein n=1 Tax=Klebsiella michiganensis TaxID=1134687 RepID=UPI003CEC075F